MLLQLAGMTDDEIASKLKLFENNIRAMKNEERRIGHEISKYRSD